jgi:hypothetical protein
MIFERWYWLIETVLFLYCLGGSWMLQIVAYPTYELVGEKEFVPFHVESGRRLIPIFVVPAVAACMASFGLPFFRSPETPMWQGILVAVCGALILVTTIVIEVPKHKALDANGKSSELIQGLVRDNLPRSLAWSVGSLVLVFNVISWLH